MVARGQRLNVTETEVGDGYSQGENAMWVSGECWRGGNMVSADTRRSRFGGGTGAVGGGEVGGSTAGGGVGVAMAVVMVPA